VWTYIYIYIQAYIHTIHTHAYRHVFAYIHGIRCHIRGTDIHACVHALQSKKCARMVSWAWADKLKEDRVSVNACHPGVYVCMCLYGWVCVSVHESIYNTLFVTNV
jgi:hypothetical protein